MNYINQHSLVVGARLVQISFTVMLLRDGIRLQDIVALSVIATTFGISWILLRPGPSTFTDFDDVEASLASGKPTLLEFQSEY